MSGYLAGAVLRRLIKGKSPQQVERAFWFVVIAFFGLFFIAFIVQSWFPPTLPQFKGPRTAVQTGASVSG